MSVKKARGQFYTVKCDYILEGLQPPPAGTPCVEPFAGKGDLLDWLARVGPYPVDAYDIEPKSDGILPRDTLANPPNYKDRWVITNPPYLARNKSASKGIFDIYDSNDLYKCAIISLTQGDCMGGILIIPAGFFLSPRDIDVRCRNDFLSKYRLLKVKYFEEPVFPDTTTTVVAFSFERAGGTLREQTVEWIMRPSGETKSFHMSAENDWIIGGDIYRLPIPSGITVRRHVEGLPLKEGEQQTFMTLNALDSGKEEGRIALTYKDGFVYKAKDCSRTYATLRISGRRLTADDQKRLCQEFNELVEEKRGETWSLFLPQYRESKEYARKRIPFELAYQILVFLVGRSQ
jgi:hypothetical protein